MISVYVLKAIFLSSGCITGIESLRKPLKAIVTAIYGIIAVLIKAGYAFVKETRKKTILSEIGQRTTFRKSEDCDTLHCNCFLY